MKTTKYALAVALGLIALIARPARADNITSYDFSGTAFGTLPGAPAQNFTFTGQFTLDSTNASITFFDFLLSNGFGGIQIAPPEGYIPSIDTTTAGVVALDFNSTSLGAGFRLFFDTTLANFDGTKFDAGASGFGGLGLGVPFSGGFTSGVATPLAATPESSSLLLFGTGLLALMGMTWRRKRLA